MNDKAPGNTQPALHHTPERKERKQLRSSFNALMQNAMLMVDWTSSLRKEKTKQLEANPTPVTLVNAKGWDTNVPQMHLACIEYRIIRSISSNHRKLFKYIH